MLTSPDLTFARLSLLSDLSSFQCTEPDLDNFLMIDALTDQKTRLSVTRLVYRQGTLVGYFTLVNGAIKNNLINCCDGEKEFRYTYYPALKIARLATDAHFERQGIGKAMLQWTIAIALNLSDHVGCRFITVDAKKNSIGFYTKYGFIIPESIQKCRDIRDTIPLYRDLTKNF
jgi:GNAT superfamily N-acetyltransferase